MITDIESRCLSDVNTKLRKKYDLYYHSFEKQEGSHVWLDGKEYILINSNDYLGLGNHPKVIEKTVEYIKKWGSGTTGARLANGSRKYHVDFEEKLADFLGKEACHISVCGYVSCMSAVQSFATRGDLLFADSNIHSCLWSGIILSGVKSIRFKHNDVSDLKKLLEESSGDNKPKLLVIEGVYSMEGHISPVDKLTSLAKKNGLFTIVDDAHGFGVLGNQGRGTVNYFKSNDKVDVICGSFSKALSSTGGFVAGSRTLIDFMRTHSKQTIFSAAISPTQAAGAEAALDIMREEPEHLEKLWRMTYKYKKMLKDLKINFWNSQTPSVPLLMNTKEEAYFFWKFLKDNGIYSIISVPPAVPAGRNLVRTAISARHTDEDLEKVYDVLKKAVKAVL